MVNTSQISIEEIMKLPLFAEMEPKVISPLIDTAREKFVQEGDFFYFQGDPAEFLFILVQGRVRQLQASEDGTQPVGQAVVPVHLFGLPAITSITTYQATAQAAVDSCAIFWSGYDLMPYITKLPQMAINAVRIMADQLMEVKPDLQCTETPRVEQRLARTLIFLAAQSGRKVKEGILIDHALTRQDIAELSGATIYTTSRKLSQWNEQELVFAGRQKVIIRNPHKLARIVEGLAE